MNFVDGFGRWLVLLACACVGAASRGQGVAQPSAPGEVFSALELHVRDALHDADAGIRAKAARYLGAFGERRHAGWLVGLVEDADAEVREQAVTALGRIGGVAAKPVVVRALEDDGSARVRGQAFWALLSIGRREGVVEDAEALAAARTVLADPDWHVHLLAVDALARGSGALDLSDEVAGLFRRYETNAYAIRRLAEGVELIKDENALEGLRPFLGWSALDRFTKHRIAAAMDHAGVATDADRRHIIEGWRDDGIYTDEAVAAVRKVGSRGWREVGRADPWRGWGPREDVERLLEVLRSR